MDIQNKAAIVTGGGTGVGRATTLALAKLGCHVLVNYSRSASEAEQTAADARALGVQAFAHQADVSVDQECREMVQAAVEKFGGLNVLVNCAGTTEFVAAEDLERVTDQMWDRIMGVNVKGPFQCARAAKEPMLASGGGCIVNVSSVAARIASGSSIPYCASKAALDNVTIALARVLAPHIRVNGVAPGFIAGRWLQQGLGTAYERVKQNFEQNMPLQKVCEPEDVASAILGFITGSNLITGQTLVIDGGMLISPPGAVVRHK